MCVGGVLGGRGGMCVGGTSVGLRTRHDTNGHAHYMCTYMQLPSNVYIMRYYRGESRYNIILYTLNVIFTCIIHVSMKANYVHDKIVYFHIHLHMTHSSCV